jgi:hypothetical protein
MGAVTHPSQPLAAHATRAYRPHPEVVHVISVEQELRYRQPGTARLAIDSEGNRVVLGAEDVIAVDLDEVNRLLAAEVRMLRRRGLVTGGAEPAPLEEAADGTLTLGAHRYRLVRRDRLRPSTAIYERIT